MSKKENETFLDYKKRVMDPISSSYCAAKWYNASIWLSGGKTTSCHSPLAHSIDINEIKDNPSALHNTFRKKIERKMMLKGIRPQGCDSCWVVEDVTNDNTISERVFKTEIYSNEDILNSTKQENTIKNHIPRNLEVAFDSKCNLACSYCNPSFSSSWVADIIKHGPYTNLLHEDQNKFNHTGDEFRGTKITSPKNPYVEAFWRWWPELITKMQEFRITGGEPLLSREVWEILDKFNNKKLHHIKLAINTNLSVNDNLIQKLINKSHGIYHLDIYTSCEAHGIHAEYIRDGLIYSNFINNCEKLITQGNIKSLNMMLTINGLSLFSITTFLDDLVRMKKTFGIQFPVWTINILRFPAFMSPLVIPLKLRMEVFKKLETWIKINKAKKYITDMELESVYRLMQFITNGKKIHNSAFSNGILEKDFKSFYSQYDIRRQKSFIKTFPTEVTEWYKKI